MARKSSDDFFADTSMSFGDHLEELRVCLFRAVIGLLIGFMIGLAAANTVVGWIQTPLTNALERYYIDKAKGELEKEFDGTLPNTLTEFMDERRFIPMDIYVEVSEAREFQKRLATAPEPEIAIQITPEGEGGEANEAETEAAAEPQIGPGLQVIPESLELGPPTNILIKTRVWEPIDSLVKSLGAQEAFMIWLKAAFISGFVISSPWIFFQIWMFIAAGLYPHERRYVHVFLPVSLLLFLSGAATAFFFVFQPVLDFLFSFNKAMNIDPDPRISEWMSFVLFLPLGFGIAFQLPLVMLFLQRIGILTIEMYLGKWRVAILGIFVISMLLTPADPISMLLMACPLTILYFLGIAMCLWMPKNRSPFGDDVYEP